MDCAMNRAFTIYDVQSDFAHRSAALYRGSQPVTFAPAYAYYRRFQFETDAIVPTVNVDRTHPCAQHKLHGAYALPWVTVFTGHRVVLRTCGHDPRRLFFHATHASQNPLTNRHRPSKLPMEFQLHV